MTIHQLAVLQDRLTDLDHRIYFATRDAIGAATEDVVSLQAERARVAKDIVIARRAGAGAGPGSQDI